jgi:hypothetical protein
MPACLKAVSLRILSSLSSFMFAIELIILGKCQKLH